jgi:hypothetical protein
MLSSWVDLIESFISPHSYVVIGSVIYHWKGIGTIFSTIYPMLPFEIVL